MYQSQKLECIQTARAVEIDLLRLTVATTIDQLTSP